MPGSRVSGRATDAPRRAAAALRYNLRGRRAVTRENPPAPRPDARPTSRARLPPIPHPRPHRPPGPSARARPGRNASAHRGRDADGGPSAGDDAARPWRRAARRSWPRHGELRRRRATAWIGRAVRAPVALGISAPGPLDPRSRRLIDPPNLRDVPWHSRSGPASARPLGLPWALDRDTNVAVLAEIAVRRRRGLRGPRLPDHLDRHRRRRHHRRAPARRAPTALRGSWATSRSTWTARVRLRRRAATWSG